MAGSKPIHRKMATPLRGAPFLVVVVKQQMEPVGSMLAALPASLPGQSFSNNWGEENQQRQPEQQQSGGNSVEFQLLAEMFHKLVSQNQLLQEMLEKCFKKIESSATSFESALVCFREMSRAMNEREAAACARTDTAQKHVTDLQLGTTFQTTAAQEEEPVCSRSELDVAATKLSVKKFALWFVVNATIDKLVGIWIQYDDLPRVSIDGIYLRAWITNELDMTDQMCLACVRMLQKREGKKASDSCGKTHYVIKEWADIVIKGGCSHGDCELLFDRPKKPYKLGQCRRIVPIIYWEKHWFSMSIDLVKRKTLLINPVASTVPYPEVHKRFEPLMRHITFIALANMRALTSMHIDSENWGYDVGLKNPHVVGEKNQGAATLFYSQPRRNQFMIVSEATIEYHKHAFIHDLVRACSKITGKKVEKGYRPEKAAGPATGKRTRNAKEPRDPKTKPRDELGKWVKEQKLKGKVDDMATVNVIVDPNPIRIDGQGSSQSIEASEAASSFAPGQ